MGDFELTMTHAFHSNSIEDNGVRHYGGEPAGYIIRMPGGFTIYHTGDTALFGDMKLIVKHVIPMHYATFPFLTGTAEQLRKETRKIKGLKIHALKAGESL